MKEMILWLYMVLASGLGVASSLKEVKGAHFISDLKYNSTDNFLKKNVYNLSNLNKCRVLDVLEKKLQALIPVLKKEKLKLVFWDCYRPLEVQRAMWKLVPDPRYVADPEKGSNHNRGAAIDVALLNEKGSLLSFPTEFDDFSPKASPSYLCSSEEKEKCQNRDKLIKIMESIGLEVFPTEWWHFQLPQAEKYPLIKNAE